MYDSIHGTVIMVIGPTNNYCSLVSVASQLTSLWNSLSTRLSRTADESGQLPMKDLF